MTTGLGLSVGNNSVTPPTIADATSAGAQTRYEVLGELGRGGMATVERVADTQEGRQVALKRLLSGDGSDEKRKHIVGLFEREYYTLAQLAHPRIIEVYDYGIDERGPYYTMELLSGGDLKARTPMPWKEASALLRDVASSLAIVHARGLLHRDVTPMNVRCTDDGRAKLIDFGAMCPMGLAPNIVGTPPFVPPEALQQTALDGRADLFALGATMYYVLTGRHAYPARTLAQLPNVWRSPVQPPSRFSDDIPQALSDLVMALLSLPAVGRPQSVAIVFERLTGIADLPRDETVDVARAYLVAPSLVGRDKPLGNGRKRLLQALRGRGSALLVSGVAGVGRSRLLDALSLEAKLLGATVLRAHAAAGRSAQFGAMQKLVADLLQARPEFAPARSPARSPEKHVQPQPEDIQWFCERLDTPLSVEEVQARRGELVIAVTRFVLDAASKTAVVLLVDDAHELDPPSLACLASIAADVKGEKLLLVVSRGSEASGDAGAALEVMAEHARPLTLDALCEADSLQLLRSVFGEVPNLQILATVIYRSCQGNPGATMVAAQHLVAQGTVDYSVGKWTIPSEPGHIESAMPRDEAMAERFAALSPEARQLVAVMALDEDGVFLPSDLLPLCEPMAVAAWHAAVAELTAARVVVGQATGYRFVEPGFRGKIAAAVPERQAQRIHERMAKRLADKGGHLVALAHHYLHAGQSRQAAAVLEGDGVLGPDGAVELVPDQRFLEVAEAVLQARVDTGAPGGQLMRLRFLTSMLAVSHMRTAGVGLHVRLLLAELTSKVGLDDYAQLSELSGPERLQEALDRAIARHEALPAEQAGYHPLEAIRPLSTTCIIAAHTAYQLLDPELGRAIPSLTPLLPLSPTLGIVERLVGAIGGLANGATYRALREFSALDDELAGEPPPGVDLEGSRTLRVLIWGYRNGMEALMGVDGMLQRCEQNEGRYPKQAEQLRLSYYVAIGDTEATRETQKRLELMQLRKGTPPGDTYQWINMLGAGAASNDVQGLSHCVDEAVLVASNQPGWGSRVRLATALHGFSRGEREQALERFQQLLVETPPNHIDYGTTVSMSVNCLLGLKRYEAAAELGEAAIVTLQTQDAYRFPVYASTALALSNLGEHSRAQVHLATGQRELDDLGFRGVLLGNFHEAAARCALLRRDRETFVEQADLCAAQYRAGYNPLLTALYDNLMRDARDQEVSISKELQNAANFVARTSATHLLQQLQTELSMVQEPESRYLRALKMVVSRSCAAGGFLYLSRQGGLQLVASDGELPKPDALDAEVSSYWDTETALDGIATATGFDDHEIPITMTDPGGTGTSIIPRPVIMSGGCVLRPLLLASESDGGEMASGVLLLAETPGEKLNVSWNALSAAAMVLGGEREVTQVLML